MGWGSVAESCEGLVPIGSGRDLGLPFLLEILGLAEMLGLPWITAVGDGMWAKYSPSSSVSFLQRRIVANCAAANSSARGNYQQIITKYPVDSMSGCSNDDTSSGSTVISVLGQRLRCLAPCGVVGKRSIINVHQ